MFTGRAGSGMWRDCHVISERRTTHYNRAGIATRTASAEDITAGSAWVLTAVLDAEAVNDGSSD